MKKMALAFFAVASLVNFTAKSMQISSNNNFENKYSITNGTEHQLAMSFFCNKIPQMHTTLKPSIILEICAKDDDKNQEIAYIKLSESKNPPTIKTIDDCKNAGWKTSKIACNQHIKIDM